MDMSIYDDDKNNTNNTSGSFTLLKAQQSASDHSLQLENSYDQLVQLPFNKRVKRLATRLPLRPLTDDESQLTTCSSSLGGGSSAGYLSKQSLDSLSQCPIANLVSDAEMKRAKWCDDPISGRESLSQGDLNFDGFCTRIEYRLPSDMRFGLRTIDPLTYFELSDGRYQSSVPQYCVIDCRYPYEFEGGHIAGAQNICQFSDLFEFLYAKSPDGPARPKFSKDIVLIFHCEFSEVRAPALARKLRRFDRELNTYPQLDYPEIYLIKGGYKAVYLTFKDVCDPCAYTRMHDIDHIDEMRFYRSLTKSKSTFGNSQSSGGGDTDSTCNLSRSRSLKF